MIIIIIMKYLISANLQYIPELGAPYKQRRRRSKRLRQYNSNNKLIHGQYTSKHNLLDRELGRQRVSHHTVSPLHDTQQSTKQMESPHQMFKVYLQMHYTPRRLCVIVFLQPKGYTLHQCFCYLIKFHGSRLWRLRQVLYYIRSISPDQAYRLVSRVLVRAP